MAYGQKEIEEQKERKLNVDDKIKYISLQLTVEWMDIKTCMHYT